MNNNFSDIEVLILVGGQGTRLRSVISNLPKPMAPIQNVPFLEIQIKHLAKAGFTNFTLLTGYMADDVEKHFSNLKIPGINIHYVVEKTPLGTGGAIANGIKNSNSNNFLVLNGDSFFELSFDRFIKEARENLKNNIFSISLCEMENSMRYGFVNLESENFISSFSEKPSEPTTGYINAGVYFFDKSLLNYVSSEKFSIETEIFPLLAKNKCLKGIVDKGIFIDIGIPEDYKLAQSLLREFI